MSNLPVFVGLDYHQDSIQVCVLDQQGKVLLNRSTGNDCQELARVVQPLGVVTRVGIEACCGAADLGEQLVQRLGWNVSLGHPAYIAKLKGSPDKSDFSDGRLIADLTRVGYLPRVWLAPAHVRELRQLVNHRQRLADRRRAIKLQVGAILREQRVKVDKGRGSRWGKAWVASVRDNERLSKRARWIVNDLLDDLTYTDVHGGQDRRGRAAAARGGRGGRGGREADGAAGRRRGDGDPGGKPPGTPPGCCGRSSATSGASGPPSSWRGTAA